MLKMLATLVPPAQAVLSAERPRLERLARRLLWDEEEARDVVGAAFVDALACWGSLKDGAAASAWLRRLVVNRALTQLRRRRVWRAVGALLLVAPEPSPAPDEALGHRRHQAALAAAVERLAARQAAAFSLRYLEGLSIDEVAEAMAIDRGTVRVHLQRAVRTLRAQGVLSEGDAS
jgi:RNA polymerase sigma-70 factor, ECF subfamily